jgi:hypothetical protein
MRRERQNAKRQKLGSLCVPTIIIADNDAERELVAFERVNPHWEGRWAGHLYLPFPPLDTLDELDEHIITGRDANSDNESVDRDENSDTSGSEDTDGEDELSESRSFLPAVRVLIEYWADVLKESFQADAISECINETKDSTTIVVVAHVPMNSDQIKRSNKPCSLLSDVSHSTPPFNNEPLPKLNLHVSLARPIYLPAPSVDSFLSSVSKCINTVVSASNLNNNSKLHGKIFHLQIHQAAIFTNDEQNRSFLTIPLTGQYVNWIKRVLLPPIDSTMKRFGLKTYYSEEGESCVLHVSVASAKGNLVKVMGTARNYGGEEGFGSLKSIPLFDPSQSKMGGVLESIPSSIPIRLNRLQCKFGQVKEISVKF